MKGKADVYRVFSPSCEENRRKQQFTVMQPHCLLATVHFHHSVRHTRVRSPVSVPEVCQVAGEVRQLAYKGVEKRLEESGNEGVVFSPRVCSYVR